MNLVVIYFLQVVLVSGIFFGYYHLFLRNREFHQYNRFYLLVSTVASLLIPFIKIPVYFSTQQDIPAVYKMLAVVRIGEMEKPATLVSSFTIENIAMLSYVLIAGFIFIRFLLGLTKIFHLYVNTPAKKMNGFVLFNTGEENTPYSFFRWLFWNKDLSIDSINGQRIFRHELVHIQQKHSWDILYLELLTIICWINPFFHLIKKETRAIHEFLADRFATNKEDTHDYAELLVMQVLKTRQRLVNPFFHNQIKRRIAMLTNSSKTGNRHLRQAMIVPVALFAITLIAVNCSSKNQKKETDELIVREVTLTDSTQHQGTPTDAKNEVVTETPTIFEKVEIEAAFPGGHEKWRDFLLKTVNGKIPAQNGAPRGRYTAFVQFVVHTDGSISDIKPLTNHGFGMEQEVIRVIKVGPKWHPAIQNGVKVNAYRKQPIIFQVEG